MYLITCGISDIDNSPMCSNKYGNLVPIISPPGMEILSIPFIYDIRFWLDRPTYMRYIARLLDMG